MRGNAARRLVEEFLDAIASHEYDRARALLADEGFEYESPVFSYSAADDFIQHISLMGAIVQKIERVKVFVDGQDVCHFLLLLTQVSDKESTKLVQWARVQDDRIKRLEILFDAHWYRRMFEADS